MVSSVQKHGARCYQQTIDNNSSSTRFVLMLYIVRDHLIMGLQPSTPVTATIETIPAMETRSEFLEFIAGKNVKDVLVVIDELVGTIQLLDSNLYNSFMRKLP